MNQIEQRALYNLLRMNWLNDPNLSVEPWQVEDYRQLPLSDLFEQLNTLSIHLDKVSFTAYADECDSPEELTEYLIGDQNIKAVVEDRIYLIIFELWRRLMSEKPSLSIFCDELDHQIYLYDQGHLKDLIALQDALANLLAILDENVDEGVNPKEAFNLISACCANDIETFLYDLISEQIDEENESYARELLDDFQVYFEANKWFTFLRARLASHSSPKISNKILSQLLEEHLEEKDLDFNFELLSFMAETGNPQLFKMLTKTTLSLLSTEEDFQDLLFICADYYHRLDQEEAEHQIQHILKNRSTKSVKDPFNAKDSDLIPLLTIVDS
jgi:hypothetical protein